MNLKLFAQSSSYVTIMAYVVCMMLHVRVTSPPTHDMGGGIDHTYQHTHQSDKGSIEVQ